MCNLLQSIARDRKVEYLCAFCAPVDYDNIIIIAIIKSLNLSKFVYTLIIIIYV